MLIHAKKNLEDGSYLSWIYTRQESSAKGTEALQVSYWIYDWASWQWIRKELTYRLISSQILRDFPPNFWLENITSVGKLNTIDELLHLIGKKNSRSFQNHARLLQSLWLVIGTLGSTVVNVPSRNRCWGSTITPWVWEHYELSAVPFPKFSAQSGKLPTFSVVVDCWDSRYIVTWTSSWRHNPRVVKNLYQVSLKKPGPPRFWKTKLNLPCFSYPEYRFFSLNWIFTIAFLKYLQANVRESNYTAVGWSWQLSRSIRVEAYLESVNQDSDLQWKLPVFASLPMHQGKQNRLRIFSCKGKSSWCMYHLYQNFSTVKFYLSSSLITRPLASPNFMPMAVSHNSF